VQQSFGRRAGLTDFAQNMRDFRILKPVIAMRHDVDGGNGFGSEERLAETVRRTAKADGKAEGSDDPRARIPGHPGPLTANGARARRKEA